MVTMEDSQATGNLVMDSKCSSPTASPATINLIVNHKWGMVTRVAISSQTTTNTVSQTTTNKAILRNKEWANSKCTAVEVVGDSKANILFPPV